LFLLRRRLGLPEKGEEHIHPSIFSFFASLYAFFLGFAIITLWSAFLHAKVDVTREADSLLIAYRMSLLLPHSEPFRQALVDYVRSVVDDEWDQMENGSMSRKANQHLDQVWDKLGQIKSDNTDFYAAIFSHLSDASKQRLARENLLEGNLYPPIWVIIIFGFISIIYGLYFNHIRQNAVKIAFDFMVLFLVLSCIFFIYDINTPFSGYIVVKSGAFQTVLTKMLALQ
jgi:hypothetical protein